MFRLAIPLTAFFLLTHAMNICGEARVLGGCTATGCASVRGAPTDPWSGPRAPGPRGTFPSTSAGEAPVDPSIFSPCQGEPARPAGRRIHRRGGRGARNGGGGGGGGKWVGAGRLPGRCRQIAQRRRPRGAGGEPPRHLKTTVRAAKPCRCWVEVDTYKLVDHGRQTLSNVYNNEGS